MRVDLESPMAAVRERWRRSRGAGCWECSRRGWRGVQAPLYSRKVAVLGQMLAQALGRDSERGNFLRRGSRSRR